MLNIIIDRFKKVDPDKELYLGHEYEKNGQRALDKRCEYCGVWFSFDIKNIQFWGDNIKMGFNGYPEKIHCGSEHCQEYHRRVLINEAKLRKEWAERHYGFLFNKLLKQGLIA